MRMTKKAKQLAVFVWMGLYGSLRAEHKEAIGEGERTLIFFRGLNVGSRWGIIDLVCIYDRATMDGIVHGDKHDAERREKSWGKFLASVKMIEVVA